MVAVVLAAVVTHTTSVLIVVVALVIMIMLHELGHLLTAKWGGMKVTEYFLGFGPRLWSIRRGETEYGIKAIPAGGYVKILGMTSAEEVDPADEPRDLPAAALPQPAPRGGGRVRHARRDGLRALLWGLFVFIGAPQGNAVAISGFAPLAHGVDPARAAGLQAGDVVVRVNGASVHSASDLQKVIEHSAGTPDHPGRRARRPGPDHRRHPPSRHGGGEGPHRGPHRRSPSSAAGRWSAVPQGGTSSSGRW